MITVKEAANTAISYMQKLFPSNLIFELEEVEKTYDNKFWLITIGMDALPRSVGSNGSVFDMINRKDRIYKVVKVNAENGDVSEMKMRLV